jgi:hypothetical protein
MKAFRAGNLEPQEFVAFVFLAFAMHDSLNKALRSIIAGLHSTSPVVDLEPSISWCRWTDE